MTVFSWQYYAKVATICFMLGGSMEYFMIKTGFYDKVVELEAQRLEETREDRELFRTELERQAAAKGIKIKAKDSS